MFVREIRAIEAGRSADCETSFDPADAMFEGHFPGNALVPGVILTEALAQTAGIAAASGYPAGEKPMFLLSGIRSMKFLRPVRPGEQIYLRAEKLAEVDGLIQFAVEAKVDDKPAAQGHLVLSIAPTVNCI